MNQIEKELAGICKDLKLLGDRSLTKSALCAYAAIADVDDPHVDLSYTYVMRELRKGDKEKRMLFQQVFKKAFDESLYADLEEPAAVALMVALKAIDFNDDEEEDEPEEDDDSAKDAPGISQELNLDRFSKVQDGLFRGGYPRPEEVELLKKEYGINKILSLDKELGEGIQQACKEAGIKHIILPLYGGDSENIERVKRRYCP